MPTRPILLTMGDPSGIGPEIALRAWAARRQHGLAPFAYVGDPGHIAARAAQTGIAVSIECVEAEHATSSFDRALPVIPVTLARPSKAGKPDPANAGAVIEAITQAVDLIHSRHARALVTNPIHKDTLYRSGFTHPGHTEFLGELARQWGKPVTPVMMIASDLLKVIPVTIHIPLAEVPHALTKQMIIDTITVAARDLETRFGLTRPRFAVAGLNPHAGENGAIGLEDERIIAPALQVLRARGHEVRGPLPADTMFHDAARARYDVAVAMYHDQALIPAKTLAFDSAVNVTLGLPFIRTSPDHGTALDIAGSGKASPQSLIAALQLAARMADAEQQHP